ncbi:hypothetical protein V8G54_007846 [Vigna mungo]|uniref:Uncharacterized protein n=1 Tax=Vigna mungo TaxID=3915 RepID=A0AAQ3S9G7_VIGMU
MLISWLNNESNLSTYFPFQVELMMQVSSICLAAKVPVRVKSLQTNPATINDPTSIAAPKWSQKTITFPPLKRGCHLVTSKILKEVGQELSGFKCGLAHLFLHHTSASLTINENYDYDVRDDTETFLNQIVPEARPFCAMEAHYRGLFQKDNLRADDMPAHIKSSMFGCALTIPITNGKLNIGTWQLGILFFPAGMGFAKWGMRVQIVNGIWLCEHRDYPTPRTVVVTLNGI